MNPNPYVPPEGIAAYRADCDTITRFRAMSVILSVIAIGIAIRQLPPLLTEPILSFSIATWLTGFLPACYFLFAAMFALLTEFRGSSSQLAWLIIVLLPLLLITCMIVFATIAYLRGFGLAFLIDWRTLLVVSICPFVWCYFAMCVNRWRSLKPSTER